MSTNLNLDQLTTGQASKEATINDATSQIDAALTETLLLDFTSADILLTNSQYQRHFQFTFTNTSVHHTLNLPAIKRFALFSNSSGYSVNVVVGATVIVIPNASEAILYSDGTINGLFPTAASGGGGGGSSSLAGDSDVIIASPINNDVLTYETASSKWKNKPSAGGGGGTGPQGPQGVPGADGIDGETGPPGLAGLAGLAGATGPQGVQGPRGDDGLDGSDGDPGVPGQAGATGPQGIQGLTGAAGLQGPPGYDGSDGNDGERSYIPGPQGPTGPPGADGASGSGGGVAIPGMDGNDGADGDPSYIPGPVGPAGNDGAQGIQGLQGAQGVQGPPGNDGIDGADGADGLAPNLAAVATSGSASDITTGTLPTAQEPDIIMGVVGHSLSLATGVPVMTSDYTAQGTVYFTPNCANYLPIWNGTKFVWRAVGEISNVLANSATGKAGAFAAAANAVYDMFVFDDSGAVRLCRSDMWQDAPTTVTITIASPGTVTHNAHGKSNGCPVRFATTGGLPVGLTAGTTYYMVNVATNTYQLAATVGGAAINTSGTQSGTHTSTEGAGICAADSGGCSSISRGTGQGLTRVTGLFTNTSTMANGPTAAYGTFVGTIRTDSTGATVSWSLGGGAANGKPAILNVWNMFNRRMLFPTVHDTTGFWSYNSATVRSAHGSDTNRITFVSGAAEDGFNVSNANELQITGTSGSVANMGFALDSKTVFDMAARFNYPGSAQDQYSSMCMKNYTPVVGGHFIQALESGDGTSTITFVQVDSSPATSRGELTAIMRG